MKVKFRYKQKEKISIKDFTRVGLLKSYDTNNTMLNNYWDISWTSI